MSLFPCVCVAGMHGGVSAIRSPYGPLGQHPAGCSRVWPSPGYQGQQVKTALQDASVVGSHHGKWGWRGCLQGNTIWFKDKFTVMPLALTLSHFCLWCSCLGRSALRIGEADQTAAFENWPNLKKVGIKVGSRLTSYTISSQYCHFVSCSQ